jgi:flagellar biosynthesis GTPase FlhF
MIATQQYPRIVRHGASHAIAVNADADNVNIICLDSDKAVYTARREALATFKRVWNDVDDVNKISVKTPTVARYLRAIANSKLAIDASAFALINVLKEQRMAYTIHVTKSGLIVPTQQADTVELDAANGIEACAALLEKHLSVRAMAAFASNVLKLEKALVRMNKGDKRIQDAVKAALANNVRDDSNEIADAAQAASAKQQQAQAERSDVSDDAKADKALAKAAAKLQAQAAKQARNEAQAQAKAERQQADREARRAPTNNGNSDKPKRASTRGPGTKQIVYDFLVKGGKATFEQLMAMCPAGITASTLRTALTDTKNPKYAPNHEALIINVSDKGVFTAKKA